MIGYKTKRWLAVRLYPGIRNSPLLKQMDEEEGYRPIGRIDHRQPSAWDILSEVGDSHYAVQFWLAGMGALALSAFGFANYKPDPPQALYQSFVGYLGVWPYLIGGSVAIFNLVYPWLKVRQRLVMLQKRGMQEAPRD